MNIQRIIAIIIRHLYLFQRSVPRIMDIFYWPIMELLVWGFLSSYLEKTNLGGFNVVSVLLGAMVFWDLLSQSQRAVSVAFLEDVWEKNLLNLFVTPLKVSEFLTATVFLGFIRVLLVSAVLGGLSFFLYRFNIFIFGFYLIPFLANLLLFGSILGIFIMAIILRLGAQAQVLAFGFIFLIQPFAAVFYPVSALPPYLQLVSRLIPASYIFEGMRAVIRNGSFPLFPLVLAFALNLIYLALSVAFFSRSFTKAKKNGSLLKLE